MSRAAALFAAALGLMGCSGAAPEGLKGSRNVQLLYTNNMDGEIEPCG